MMKRILFIDDDQERNGSTVSLEYLIQGFYEHDYEVYLLSCKINESASAVLRPYANVIDGRRWYLPNISLSVHFTFRSSCFSFQGLKNFLKDFVKFVFGFFIALRTIATVKPDIVYLNEYRVVQAAIAAKILRVPTVTHVRSRFLEERFFVRRFLLAKAILKYCDILIAITSQEKLQFQPYCKNNMDKIIVVGEFVFIYQFNAVTVENVRRQYHLPDSKKIVLMLGGIRYLKGTMLFLKSAELVSQSRNDVVFVVVGVSDIVYAEEDPQYYFHCKQIIERLMQNYGNAYTIGRVLNPMDLITVSDIVISPYTEAHFSRPIVEAWGLNKPVIATRTKYTIDLIEDNVDGILIDNDDFQGMAKAINTLLDDKKKQISMGKEGKKKVNQKYSYKKNVDRIVSICNLQIKSR